MNIEAFALNAVRFFHEDKPGRYIPQDNAPAYLYKFVMGNHPRLDTQLIFRALNYLASGIEIPKYPTRKYLEWLQTNESAPAHIDELLNQKTPPKSLHELLEKAYFYEFQRIVNLIRKFYDTNFTHK